jgi:hypothetical protein
MNPKSRRAKGNYTDAAFGENTESITSVDGSEMRRKRNWISGIIQTAAGDVPTAKTRLSFADMWGAVKVRCGIGRAEYRVLPGLYAAGTPGRDAPVFVSANYKLSFDKLRAGLNGLDAWILVLDTKGVNVWCAAGKGTFGTRELADRLEAVQLKRIVRHRNLILPQLGAVGVSAHAVREACGFRVAYGPVRAEDIKKYLAEGYKKTPAMRTINFGLKDRMVLAPLELVHALPSAFIILCIMAALHLLRFHGLDTGLALEYLPFAGAIIAGTMLFPVLLPYLPFRSFALKGALLGLAWAVGSSFFPAFTLFTLIAHVLLLTPLTAFFALNFTGSSTYTSLAGVKVEVRTAIPIFVGSIIAGTAITIVSYFGVLGGV